MGKHKKLNAILPMLLRDYERFEILNKSLNKFCHDLIDVCWVITRDSEYRELHRKINNNFYKVIPESMIIPELRFWRFIKRAPSGWHVQQIIKLAIAQKVQTDFYLTLDSDVVCIRPVVYEDLIRNGRALSTIEPDIHPDWYRDAERLLGIPRSGLSHGVTPAILNRHAVIELQEFLTQRFLIQKANPVLRALRVLSSVFPSNSVLNQSLFSWRSFLIGNTPWTEYSLYNTFLEGKNIFEKYHIRGGRNCIYGVDHSVWYEKHWPDWNLKEALNGEGFFIVIQSNTKLPARSVWDKVRKHLEA
ncbi:MAG: DUF6492 family protein [Nitrospirota bacterium]